MERLDSNGFSGELHIGNYCRLVAMRAAGQQEEPAGSPEAQGPRGEVVAVRSAHEADWCGHHHWSQK